ncbi:hypothetical protein ACFV2N_48155 [Streptomyces sp. NPDC059680]|uniref:DUF7933 domain-containing protein n=1 Tax=Streptomyces sp. NPDC059680 TaxID=3346904 RepID=UPI0036C840C8
MTFSVDVAAQSCEVPGAAPPMLQFSMLDGQGNATPAGSPINGCSSPQTVPVPQTGNAPATTAHVGTYTSDGAVLVKGGSIGIRMVNNTGTGTGNDHAFDNIRILDVTPSVTQVFSPNSITTGENSTLTFTINNTSELGAKNDFGLTDPLPAGVTIASTPNASTTCGNGTVSAAAGGSSIALTGGDLAQGSGSCTVTVDVTSNTPGTYVNSSSGFVLVGLNPPSDASLVVAAPVTPVPMIDPAIGSATALLALGGTLYLRRRNAVRKPM